MILLSREITLAGVRRWVVPALVAVAVAALAVRVAAFFLLPNIDGDAYCYLDKAREFRDSILSGRLRVQDLFYFWLPLYPLVISVISLVLPGSGRLLFVGKLVSAVSGLAVCWFVYRLLVTLTRRPLVALVGALCVALDPWQLLYSSNSMTEVPFEAFVLAALDRTVARRWTAASVILMCAGFLRIEAWPLAGLVPVAAFFVERKIKLWPVLLVCVAPAAWLAISYAAKGDVRAYFTIRNAYVAEYLAHNPGQEHLTLKGIQGDFSNLRQGASLPLMLGAFAAVGTLVARFFTRRKAVRGTFAAAAAAGVYLFLLVFLLAAYVTRAQPVLWVRYGMIYEPLGVCLTLWWLTECVGARVRWIAAVLLVCGVVTHTVYEVPFVSATRGNLLLLRQGGAALAALHPQRVYCDNVVVRVESDLPPDRIVDSFGTRRDPAGFLEDLRLQKIDYLVYVNAEASTPVKLFPELSEFRAVHGLEPVREIASSDWRPAVLIYRVTPAVGRDLPTPRNGD